MAQPYWEDRQPDWKRAVSDPAEEFHDQMQCEWLRISEADPRYLSRGTKLDELRRVAVETVRKLWLKGGFWDANWDHALQQPYSGKFNFESRSHEQIENRRLLEQESRIIWERKASEPSRQFKDQELEEEAHIQRSGHPRNKRFFFFERGERAVKESWREQGIWDEKLPYCPRRWKHEVPLVWDSDSDKESEESVSNLNEGKPTATGGVGLFGNLTSPPEAGTSSTLDETPPAKDEGLSLSKASTKENHEKTEKKKPRSITERIQRKDALLRERNASRPYYQFMWQLSEERELILGEPNKDQEIDFPTDINSQAYENVKATWTKRGIWNERWGLIPGMSWKHEDYNPPCERIEEDPSYVPWQPEPAKNVKKATQGLFGEYQQEEEL